MKAIVGFPGVNFRRLLTVNSTYNTALAAGDAAMLPVDYAGYGGRYPSIFTAATVAGTSGRWLDIASSLTRPYVSNGAGEPVTLGPEVNDSDVEAVFVPPRLMLVPIGASTDGQTFLTQACAGRPWADSDTGALTLIAPQPAVEFRSTLSARPTTSTGFTNEKFSDLIAYPTSEAANKNFPCEIEAATGFVNYTFGAAIIIQTQGARFWFIRGMRETSAVDFNWLWAAF